MNLAIETCALSRRFGDRQAVDRINLQVPEGSVYGFLGRNGAGKTTTLRLLLGVLRADAGEARICGIDVGRERLRAAREVGALLESHGLYAHLSGRENLDVCRRLRGLPASEIDRVLDIAGLSEHARRRVGDYSLGMRQRLGLARALLGSPRVLILDEPSNGLDPEGMADMRRFLRTLPQRTGATVLLSSHMLDEIERTATHVGILSAGRLVRQGSLDALRAEQGRRLRVGVDRVERGLEVARMLGWLPTPCEQGFELQFESAAAIDRIAADLNRHLCQAGVQVHALVPLQPRLESLYRDANTTRAEPASAPSSPEIPA